MEHILDKTGLTYFFGKLKALFATKTELAGHPTGKIYYGTCSTAAKTYAKSATVETFPTVIETVDNVEVTKPMTGIAIGVKYANSNTYKTEGHTYTLNVNNTGDYPMYYNGTELTTSTSANTLVAGYANRYVFYMFNGTQWVFISASYDANSTYSAMTQTEITAGTGTTGRTMTPKLLRDNFYTEDEVDTLLESKANSNDLATVATSGSYNDLDGTPTIPTVPTALSAFTDDLGSNPTHTHSQYLTSAPVTSVNGQTGAVNLTIPAAVTESTVSGWGFTKNTGTYSKPSDGIPKTDLESSVQTSLGKADTALQSFTESDPTVPSHVKGITTTDISNWNSKQAAIADLSDIRSGAALGATALQSYTETDPTVPAWAKAANKPSYNLDEVSDGSTRQLPTKVSDLQNDSGFTTNTGTVTSTGGTVAVNNIQVVSALPASPDANTLYLIPE